MPPNVQGLNPRCHRQKRQSWPVGITCLAWALLLRVCVRPSRVHSTAQLETSPSRTPVARPAELYRSGCEKQEGRGDQAEPAAYRQEVWRSEPERTQLWSPTVCSVFCFCLHSCYLLCSILATLILEHQACLRTHAYAIHCLECPLFFIWVTPDAHFKATRMP